MSSVERLHGLTYLLTLFMPGFYSLGPRISVTGTRLHTVPCGCVGFLCDTSSLAVRQQPWMGSLMLASLARHRAEPQSHSLAVPSRDVASSSDRENLMLC